MAENLKGLYSPFKGTLSLSLYIYIYIMPPAAIVIIWAGRAVFNLQSDRTARQCETAGVTT